MNARFPKSHRLLTRRDFQRVFKRRTSVANQRLVVYAAPNQCPHCRIGLVVSRKVGNAVVRNRWKRLLREAFRQQQHALTPGWDFVVLPLAGPTPSWNSVVSAFAELAEKAVRKAGRKRRSKSDFAKPANATSETTTHTNQHRGDK